MGRNFFMQLDYLISILSFYSDDKNEIIFIDLEGF